MKYYDAWEDLKDVVREHAQAAGERNKKESDAAKKDQETGRIDAYYHILRVIDTLEEKYE